MRPLGGVPLLSYTLETASRAESLTRVVVSTDCDAVADLALKTGAQVLRRPAELAGPLVHDLPVVVHALEHLDAKDDDLVVLLRPTAPFRRRGEVDYVVRLMRDWPEVASIRAVVRGHSPQKLYREAGFRGLPYTALVPYSPFHQANGPRQALEPVWKPCGLIDAVRAQWPLVGSLEGPLIAAYQVQPERAIDIDDEDDWAAAEGQMQRPGVWGWK